MVRGLGWGDFSLASDRHPQGGLFQLLKDVSGIGSGKIDFILGSDTFYNPPGENRELPTCNLPLKLDSIC